MSKEAKDAAVKGVEDVFEPFKKLIYFNVKVNVYHELAEDVLKPFRSMILFFAANDAKGKETTERLTSFLGALERAGTTLPLIIFISFDKSKEDYNIFWKSMSWPSMMWNPGAALKVHQILFGANHSIKTAVCVLERDLKWSLVSINGASRLATDPEGRNFPWKPQIQECKYLGSGCKKEKGTFHRCKTCKKKDHVIVCDECLKLCHYGHKFESVSMGYCMCGASESPITCQCFKSFEETSPVFATTSASGLTRTMTTSSPILEEKKTTREKPESRSEHTTSGLPPIIPRSDGVGPSKSSPASITSTSHRSKYAKTVTSDAPARPKEPPSPSLVATVPTRTKDHSMAGSSFSAGGSPTSRLSSFVVKEAETPSERPEKSAPRIEESKPVISVRSKTEPSPRVEVSKAPTEGGKESVSTPASPVVRGVDKYKVGARKPVEETFAVYGYTFVKHQGSGLVKELGKGQFGVVSLVQDGKGLVFALKKVRCDDIRAENLASNEAQYFLNISNEHCVACYRMINHKEADQRFVVLIQEFCDGGSLEAFIQNMKVSDRPEAKLGEKKLLRMMLDMALGIDWLHSTRKLIHRDLKPSNILLMKDFKPKIADLGLVVPSEMNYTDRTGTLSFMAPEIFASTPYNTPVDIWALGLIYLSIVIMEYAISFEGDLPDGKSTVSGGELARHRPGEFLKILEGYLVKVQNGKLRSLIKTMLALEQTARPNIKSVIASLNTTLLK